MNLLFLFIVGVYSTVIVFATVKWVKLVQRKMPVSGNPSGFISVIIPVRNEAVQIPRLLSAIGRQSFSSSLFEVIVVDDHSTDETRKFIEEKKWPFKLIALSLEEISKRQGVILSGKKQAISQGIIHATGDIIVTTDADCYMGVDWLRTIDDYFSAGHVQMLAGPVVFDGANNLFEKMQTIEFAALIGAGAVALDAGNPNMCNGANLAFKKQAFEAVGGYEGNLHIPSGDDEFLLQKIHRQFPGQVYFNTAKVSAVYTSPVKKLSTFVNQRRRWASKWKLHKSVTVKLVALSVFGFHLSMIGFLICAVFTYLHPLIFIVGFCAKAVGEYIFIHNLFRHFGKSLRPGVFILLQGIYSVYVVVFGVLSNFGSFEWKGRNYKQ